MINYPKVRYICKRAYKLKVSPHVSDGIIIIIALHGLQIEWMAGLPTEQGILHKTEFGKGDRSIKPSIHSTMVLKFYS